MRWKISTMDAGAFLWGLPVGSVNLIAADPPYNVVNRPSGGLRSLDKGSADGGEWQEDFVLEGMGRALSSNGTIYLWGSTEQVGRFREKLDRQGYLTRVGVWEKTNPSPMNGEKYWLSSVELFIFARRPKAVFNEHCKSPVFRASVERVAGFPLRKNRSVIERMIAASSNPDDMVCDPFLGSGTTAEAAVKLGRRFIGCDNSPEAVALAERRLMLEFSNRKM